MLKEVSTHQAQMMTDNVLTLLRGSSRNVINKLKIRKGDVDVDRVMREVGLLAQERGMAFAKNDYCGYRCTIFRIHV